MRYKLLKDGKLMQYFRYALGEIVLVVLGIMIAIQINSWYNGKVLQAENKQLLIKLRGDLVQDTLRLHRIADTDREVLSYKTAIEHCKTAASLLYLPMNESIADSLLSLGYTAAGTLINTQTTVYDQLKSTGRLYNIASDSSRQKIIAYYTTARRDEYYLKQNANEFVIAKRSAPILSRLRDDRFLKPQFSYADYPELFDPKSEEIIGLRHFFTTGVRAQRSIYFKLQMLKNEAKDLIEALDQEINKT